MNQDHTHQVQGPRLLVPAEAAEFLRLSLAQLYHLTSRRQVPFMKLGGQLRFDRERLIEWVAERTEAAAQAPRRRGARKPGSKGRRASEGAIAAAPFEFKTPRRRP